LTRGECDERSGGGRREGSAFGEQKIQIWPIYRGRGHGQSPGHIQPPSRSICASSTLHYNNESLLASRRRVFQILTPSLYCPMSESLLCYHHHHHLLYQVRALSPLSQPTRSSPSSIHAPWTMYVLPLPLHPQSLIVPVRCRLEYPVSAPASLLSLSDMFYI